LRVVATGPPWLCPAFAFVPVWASPYLPTLSGQRGITPAFGYDAPHPSVRGTLTLPNNALLSAHYGLLRPCAPLRYSHPYGDRPLGFLPSHRGDRFPRSAQKPDAGSRRLHAGCHPDNNQGTLRTRPGLTTSSRF
jgi:hypothetical protein